MVGDISTIVASANTDWNNRQLHPSERQVLHSIANKLAEKNAGKLELTSEQWEEILEIQALAEIDESSAK